MNLETLFLYTAVGGGVVLAVQLATVLLGWDEEGLGESGSADGVTDGAGFWFFEMISIRTLAAATTFFGLVGGAVNSTGAAAGVSLAAALVAGYSAMYAVYWAFRQLFRLETSGNEDVYNAIGATAEVYVPIAESNRHAGKVHLVLQGRIVEYQAITDADHPLATGEKVVVTDVVSSDTLKVMPEPNVEMNPR